MAGRSSTQMGIFGLLGLVLVIAVIMAAVLLSTNSSPTSSSTTTTGGPSSATTTTSILSLALIQQCTADAKTVDTAVAVYQAENPLASIGTSLAWHRVLVTGSGATLQSWPSSRYFSIVVAGTGSPRDTGDAATPRAGDVVVTVTSTHKTFDETEFPGVSCTHL